MNKILKLLIIILIGSSGAIYASAAPVEIESVRNLGMGGPGTTFMSKYDILYNPALISLRSKFSIRLFDLQLGISNDISKFYKFYKDNKTDLEDFENIRIDRQVELLDDIITTVSKYNIRLRAGILNPRLSLGPVPLFVKNSKMWIGVGFFNQLDVGIKMNAGLLIPTVDVHARADAVLVVPAAYRFNRVPLRLPGELTAGVNLKYMIRSRYEVVRLSILDFGSLSTDSSGFEPGYGLGWDWGLLYDFSDNLNFAFVIKDLFGTRISYADDTSEVIKSRVSFGTAYKVTKMIKVAADVRDFKINDIGKSTLFTKLYMGGEIDLIKILQLRGGFYQGYPSFGFGLAGILNYAFYGRELSAFPGLQPEWNHMFSLNIGL